MTNIIMFGIIVILLVLLIIFVIKNNKKSIIDDKKIAEYKIDLIKELSESERRQEKIINNGLFDLKDMLDKQETKSIEERSKSQEILRAGLIDIQESTEKRLMDNAKGLNETLADGMNKINELTDKKLNDIQGNVNEKLDKSLNERLDENFKQVGERLESLYKSLGEIKNLEMGVTNLNKTLSNVKTRGIFGEIQLGNILSNTLDKSQYEENIPTKPRSSDPVEFAIKIPDKEDNNGFIYLPIDAKFPVDIYNRVIDASKIADSIALESAQKELKNRILSEAKTIRDKYIAPPNTTDFAIMFLPTEGLYAEVLRIDGLAETCQEKYKIVICGPMNLTAMINSLSIGFKYLTVNKKTDEIRKTLLNFKAQFDKFDDLIVSTQKSLDQAKTKTEKISKRNEMIRSRLAKVEKLEYEEQELIEENE